MDMNPNDRRVTLQEFSAAVGCHFTTASRIRSGERMPGRELYQKIVTTYGLDPREALEKFLGSRQAFGLYLRENVFNVTAEEMERDRILSSIRRSNRKPTPASDEQLELPLTTEDPSVTA